MSSLNLQFLLKNNLFRKIYILIVLLFTALLICNLFGETFYICCKLTFSVFKLTFSPERSVGKNEFCGNEVEAKLTFLKCNVEKLIFYNIKNPLIKAIKDNVSIKNKSNY